ncbi:hypothetical protein V4B17_03200 [Bartonella sp. B23]
MGKVKNIYIDLPYNTGNAFEYYEDSLERSIDKKRAPQSNTRHHQLYLKNFCSHLLQRDLRKSVINERITAIVHCFPKGERRGLLINKNEFL